MSGEIDKLPGLKEAEIAKLGPCAVCKQALLDREKGGLTFYRLTLSRAMFMPRNIERRLGLQAMLGGISALAMAMGPDEDLAKVIDEPREMAIHEGCAGDITHLLLLLGN